MQLVDKLQTGEQTSTIKFSQSPKFDIFFFCFKCGSLYEALMQSLSFDHLLYNNMCYFEYYIYDHEFVVQEFLLPPNSLVSNISGTSYGFCHHVKFSAM